MSEPTGREAFREFVVELKSKADIVQVVGEAVALRRAGRSYKGLCPFHGEKTPSFNVDPARQMFHCFGCGKGGDVISFVMEHEHLPFPDAARKLAERFSVVVPEWREKTAEDRARDERRRQVGDALSAAQQLFEERLYADDDEGRRARGYLKGRGLDSTIARTFGIGYAPADPAALERALVARGFEPAALREAGLLRFGQDGRAMGAFRARVTFPIRSASGKLLGFGARTLGDGEPKYINSSDSELFRKGNNLYGLFEAVKALRSGGTAILVEGNLDVVSLHKAGLTTAVAPLGTALTPEQCELLASHTGRAVVMFDGDAAGQRAALRALPLLLRVGLEVTVAVLPSGADPDALVRADGAGAIESAREAALDPVTFAIEQHGRGLDLGEPRYRARIVDELRPVIAATKSPVERQSYFQIVADRLGVDERVVAEGFERGPERARAPVPPPRRDGAAAPREIRIGKTERVLLRGLLEHPELRTELGPLLEDDLLTPEARRIWRAIEESAPDDTEPAVQAALDGLSADPELPDVDRGQTAACLLKLREEWIVRRSKALRQELAQAEKAGETERRLELSRRVLDLDRQAEQIRQEIPTI